MVYYSWAYYFFGDYFTQVKLKLKLLFVLVFFLLLGNAFHKRNALLLW